MKNLRMSAVYEREPWGYLGMTVRIFRAKADGSLYAMRAARGATITRRQSQPGSSQ